MTERLLDHQEIIRAAGYATGHFGMLDAGFSKRLQEMTDWLNANGGLTPAETTAARKQLVQITFTRLKLAADRQRIPDIAREKIERPIIVIGYSRTGTTLLHSLLAEDPENRSPLWWHTHQPSPPPGEMAVAPERIAQAQREIDRWNDALPGMFTMHPYWDNGAHALIEDEEVFTLDFQNAYPTLLYQIPALTVMGNVSDSRGAYQFHREFLQHMQWNIPARRWAIKGCYHQFNLKELFDTYPDALCIWPHRDPVEVHKSTLAISSVLYSAVTNGQIDWHQFATGYMQATRAGIDKVMADPLVDDPRIIHLQFHDVAKDPVNTLKRIYQHWSLPYTAEFEQRMHAWLANPANKPDRYGRYPYSYEPFGLKAEDVAKTFVDYSKRFWRERFNDASAISVISVIWICPGLLRDPRSRKSDGDLDEGPWCRPVLSRGFQD